MLAAIVGERNALCGKSVGGDDVGSSFQVLPMNVGDDVGTRQAEHIVVARLWRKVL